MKIKLKALCCSLIFIICLSSVAEEEPLFRDIIIRDFYEGMPIKIHKDKIFMQEGFHSIKAVDFDGQVLGSIGKHGKQPGEIMRLSWFAINPSDDNIYITEAFGGNQRISIFSKNGDYISEYKFKTTDEWISFSQIEFDSKGNVFIQANRLFSSDNYKQAGIVSEENAIFKFDEKGYRKVYSMSYKQSADRWEYGNVSIPYSNTLSWLIAKDRIIVRDSHSEYIKVLDTEGNELGSIKLPFEREKFTEYDMEKWIDDIKDDDLITDIDFWKHNTPLPEYKPVSAGTLVYDGKETIFSRNYNNNSWAFINIIKGDLELRNLGGSLIMADENNFYFLTVDEQGNTVIRIIKRRCDKENGGS